MQIFLVFSWWQIYVIAGPSPAAVQQSEPPCQKPPPLVPLGEERLGPGQPVNRVFLTIHFCDAQIRLHCIVVSISNSHDASWHTRLRPNQYKMCVYSVVNCFFHFCTSATAMPRPSKILHFAVFNLRGQLFNSWCSICQPPSSQRKQR